MLFPESGICVYEILTIPFQKLKINGILLMLIIVFVEDKYFSHLIYVVTCFPYSLQDAEKNEEQKNSLRQSNFNEKTSSGKYKAK